MVEIRDLSLRYPLPDGGAVEALSGVNAHFDKGTVTAIIGPSGCGKTSLIKAAAGLIEYGGGEIRVEGHTIRAVKEQVRGQKRTAIRKKTAVIFQDYGLLPWKTVRANAELPLKLAGVPASPRRKRTAALLEEFGLAGFEKRYPREISGGMKQRLAIVRSLATEPDLLLMDEPFSSLDALTREDAQDFLLSVREKRPLTVIIVTHSIEEAVYLSDRVYVMTGKNPGVISACFEVPPEFRRNRNTRTNRDAFGELCGELRSMLRGRAEQEEGTASRPPPRGSVRLLFPLGKIFHRNTWRLFLAILGFAGLWAIAAILAGKPFLPGPAAAVTAWIKLVSSGTLGRHVWASLSRIGWALVTSFIPAAVLGLAAGRIKRLNALVSPAIYLIHPLPKAAFLPIIMLILGLGEASKIFLVGFIIFSQVLVTARDAAGRINEELAASVRSLGAGPAGIVREVIIPAALPGLFTGLRVSLGTAVAVLFLAETFATDTGLGYLIIDAWTRVSYPEMYAAILTLSLLGLVLFIITDVLEKLLCPWQESLNTL
jgi:ABC-type nitrate/sulfonate/bicarbonate transport system ATPase subunit/ABC-type nitrate/sulfonate/bicarbonate transport system permease component